MGPPPSKAHYFLVLLGIVGGLIGYILVRDRDSPMAKRILGIGAVVTVLSVGLSVLLDVVVFNAVNSLGNSLTLPTTPTTATTLPLQTTTTTLPANAVQAGATTKTWTFTAKSSNGYSESGSIAVGTPQRYKTNLANGSYLASTSCSITAQTDGVTPFVITVTNTTKNFSTKGVATFSVTVPYEDTDATAPTVNFEANWTGTGSGECDSSSTDRLGLISTTALAPNDDTELYGFFIIANYYSPAHPHGDTALLTRVEISLASELSSGTGDIVYTTESLSGPGVAQTSTGEDGYRTFYLSGKTPAPTTTD